MKENDSVWGIHPRMSVGLTPDFMNASIMEPKTCRELLKKNTVAAACYGGGQSHFALDLVFLTVLKLDHFAHRQYQNPRQSSQCIKSNNRNMEKHKALHGINKRLSNINFDVSSLVVKKEKINKYAPDESNTNYFEDAFFNDEDGELPL